MKIHHFAPIVVGLQLIACGAGAPSDTESHPAEFVQENLVSASSSTTEQSGIVSWELQKADDGSRVLGRSITGQVLADLKTLKSTEGCAVGKGKLVTTIATLPAPGRRQMGCGGEVLNDSLDRVTRLDADLLLRDLASAAPPPVTSSQTQGFGYGPPYGLPPPPNGPFNTCVPHTDTKCILATYWCKNTNQDCSTSSWSPCGVCWGLW